MVRRLFALAAIILFALILLPLVTGLAPFSSLSPVAETYAADGPEELGAANLVTAVIVTYRGLDTLGEVTVLFIATAGVGFLLRREEGDEKTLKNRELTSKEPKRPASEILSTGSMFLLPLLFLLGIYIFVHGHLTPGGGFQGGVVIAGGMLLVMLSRSSHRLNHLVLTLLESLSGFSYLLMGAAGLFLAAGFLDNSIIPLGDFGKLISAGAIPIIYSLIGLKVGTELTNILDTMKKEQE